MDFNEIVAALKAPPVQGWNRKLIWRGTFSALMGSILGMVTSLVVNVALVEISISRFFALYFGFLFIVTGCAIAWRVAGSPLPDELSKNRQRVFLILSGMVSISGLLCCFLTKSWFFGMPRLVKVPIYTLLGTCIAFAVIFSAIDLMNVIFGLCTITSTRSPVESTVQVSMVVSVALLMGGIFGCVFGLMDVANEITYHVRLSLIREESFCYPIGGAIGLLAGFANEYLRNQEEGYIQLKRSEYDADI